MWQKSSVSLRLRQIDHGLQQSGGKRLPPGHRHPRQRAAERWEKAKKLIKYMTLVFKNSESVVNDGKCVSVLEVFFAQKVERECKNQKTHTSTFERVSCAK